MSRSVEEIRQELVEEYTANLQKKGKNEEEIAEYIESRSRFFDKRAAKEAKIEREKEEGIYVDPYEDVVIPEQVYVPEPDYAEVEPKTVKNAFPDIKVGNIIIKFVKEAKEVGACFKIPTGQDAYLISTEKSHSHYEVRLKLSSGNDSKVVFEFPINKSLTAIGSNNKEKFYKYLRAKMEEHGITPDYGKANFDENFEQFVLDLQMADDGVNATTNSYKWQKSDKDEVPKKTWAEATGMQETFDDSIKEQAKEILNNQNFLQYMVQTIENVVISQRDKITLASLIALSSCVDDILHSLGMGSPGSGKSTIGEHVYKVFPKQRKFEFTAESTVAGLINATKFADGSKVFKNKLLYLGDLGNEDQQKNPKVQEIIGMLRILMEKKEYTKVVTDMNSEDGTPITLTLDSCGSVVVECISKKMEGQFEDRCVRWSPSTGSDITAQIDAFHNDELRKAAAEARFNKNRPIVASGIELLFEKVEGLSRAKNGFKIFNPYNDFLFKLFDIGGTIGNRGRKNLRTLPKLVALSNLFQRDTYWNEKEELWAIVVKPEDIIYTLTELGKAIGYMLSPIPENVLGYIEKIEENFIEGKKWPYLYDDYKHGFADLFLNDEERNEFIGHLAECKPITAKEMADLMHVQPDTARGYLNDLADKEILYLEAEKGKANKYYPVSDFDSVKQDIWAQYPSYEDIEGLTEEIEEIYKQFIKDLKDAGYVKD
jgi:hypothetical protein